jgi:hypothetical protein
LINACKNLKSGKELPEFITIGLEPESDSKFRSNINGNNRLGKSMVKL